MDVRFVHVQTTDGVESMLGKFDHPSCKSSDDLVLFEGCHTREHAFNASS